VWLRAFTTTMLIATLALMLTRPLIVGPPPHRPAKRAEALAFSQRALFFTGMLIVTVAGAGYGAIKLTRIAKEEYRRQAVENMKALIASTIAEEGKRETGKQGTGGQGNLE
jgi:hypothetical protein